LDLAEKHYENLLEALTDNVIYTAIAYSSSNPTLGLPQSLLTYPSPSNQSDTYRINDLDIYHNDKGDIAD
jgi:hypothetical protein